MPINIEPIDTRKCFRPLAAEFVAFLRELEPAAWTRQTVAPRWKVRDIVAHLLDTTLRRLSAHRDNYTAPVSADLSGGERELVAFINQLNASWVEASQRMSPRVLTDLYAGASAELAEFLEALPLDAPALYRVSWAGDDGDWGWLDVGRDFTEQWHHQMQVRDAVGGPPPSDPAWLHMVLRIAMCGLPHAYANTAAPDGAAVLIDVSGQSGGSWTLVRDADTWVLSEGAGVRAASTHAQMSADTAWRLLFNALKPESLKMIHHSGDESLVSPLLKARMVIV